MKRTALTSIPPTFNLLYGGIKRMNIFTNMNHSIMPQGRSNVTNIMQQLNSRVANQKVSQQLAETTGRRQRLDSLVLRENSPSINDPVVGYSFGMQRSDLEWSIVGLDSEYTHVESQIDWVEDASKKDFALYEKHDKIANDTTLSQEERDFSAQAASVFKGKLLQTLHAKRVTSHETVRALKRAFGQLRELELMDKELTGIQRDFSGEALGFNALNKDSTAEDFRTAISSALSTMKYASSQISDRYKNLTSKDPVYGLTRDPFMTEETLAKYEEEQLALLKSTRTVRNLDSVAF